MKIGNGITRILPRYQSTTTMECCIKNTIQLSVWQRHNSDLATTYDGELQTILSRKNNMWHTRTMPLINFKEKLKREEDEHSLWSVFLLFTSDQSYILNSFFHRKFECGKATSTFGAKSAKKWIEGPTLRPASQKKSDLCTSRLTSGLDLESVVWHRKEKWFSGRYTSTRKRSFVHGCISELPFISEKCYGWAF